MNKGTELIPGVFAERRDKDGLEVAECIVVP
jgi:hypothetical protein